jgi:hypothetical protein
MNTEQINQLLNMIGQIEWGVAILAGAKAGEILMKALLWFLSLK